ncbi:MAG: ABC transporter substrate-binding protein [Pseudomonadota bacterium]
MRALEHAAGTTCIPEDPQRIVAFDSRAAATPLLELGAPVVGTWWGEMEDGSVYVRGASDIFGQDFVDASGIAPVAGAGGVDLEATAALQPDLILIGEWLTDQKDQLTSIAPTIVLPENVPYLDLLGMLADAANLTGSYERELAEYRARIEELREIVGDPSSITVSRMDIDADGIWYYPNWGAVDQVIDDAGFSRPEIQAAATSDITGMSIENVMAFDGDVLLVSYAPRFGQTISDLTSGWMSVGNDLWRTLPVVQDGNLYWYERDIWTGQTFASLHAAIDGLTLLTAGRSFE